MADQIEKGFARIDEILLALEKGELSLEESFALYREGVGLIKEIDGSVGEIEKKLAVLREDGTTVNVTEEELKKGSDALK